MGDKRDFVWLFDGGGIFPAGVFPTRESAETWIAAGKASGTLAKYSSIISLYDWATSNEVFKPTNDRRPQTQFASPIEFYQFVDGVIR